MQYNKRKHLKLLKSSPKSESFRLKGKSLTAEEFEKFMDSRPITDENFFELHEYSAMMIDHLHWENREHYFELIEKLLNGPLHFLELREKYEAINDAVESLEDNLILLEPDGKSEGFSLLIGDLIMYFDLYCPDPSLRESHELSEEELRDVFQKIFIEMKEPTFHTQNDF